MKLLRKPYNDTKENQRTSIMGYVVLDMMSLVPRQQRTNFANDSITNMQAIDKSRLAWEKLALKSIP